MSNRSEYPELLRFCAAVIISSTPFSGIMREKNTKWNFVICSVAFEDMSGTYDMSLKLGTYLAVVKPKSDNFDAIDLPSTSIADKFLN